MPQIILNNQTVIYNNIYYISTSGNDTTGNGTNSNPFATYTKAFSLSKDGDLIYFIKGNYNITVLDNIDNSICNAFLYDKGKQLIIYAEPYTYININNPTGNARDSHAISIRNTNTKIIGFIINYYIINKDGPYSRSIFGSDINAILKGTIYNCHFIIRSTTSFSYANSGNTLVCSYCQFDIKTPLETNYSGVTSFNNCAFAVSNVSSTKSLINDLGGNSISNSLTFASNYEMNPNTDNCGIYYGLYIWLFIRLLIQDGTYIETILNDDLITKDTLPYTADKFNSYGMNNLSSLNSDNINKIQSQKYKLALLRIK